MFCEAAVRLHSIDLVLESLSSAKEILLRFLRSHKFSMNHASQQGYPHVAYTNVPVPLRQPSNLLYPVADQLIVPLLTLTPQQQIAPVQNSPYLNQCNNSNNNFHRRTTSSSSLSQNNLDQRYSLLQSCLPQNLAATAKLLHQLHSGERQLRCQSLSPPSTPDSLRSTSPPDPVTVNRICVSDSNLITTTNIRHEILKQLQPGRGILSTPSVVSEQRDEETPIRTSGIMQAKGVKRQLEIGGSPHVKRGRFGSHSRGGGPQSRGGGPQSRGGSHNQHNFRDEWQYPNMSSPPTPMHSDPYAKASNHIWQYFLQNQQTSMTYSRKMALRDALFSVMRGVFPHCGLYVVGSSMNGFGGQSSDMDLCLMISHSVIDQKKEATEILRVLFKAIRSFSFIKHPLFIKAKVPIIKFYDKKSGVECDLNVNNAVGIRNTHLLNSYSKLDWRVRPLVLFIKHWAKTQDINDASKATISSYSLVLMVIHYLQCGCSPPVLPSLHQEYPYKFSRNLDVRALSLNETLPTYQSNNKQSLGELFTGFLDYYANYFNFERDAISVRFGKKLPKEVIANQNPDIPLSQWKYLCIEEPFDLSNTARSVYDGYIFQRILHVIRASHRKMAQTRDVNSVLRQPF